MGKYKFTSVFDNLDIESIIDHKKDLQEQLLNCGLFTVKEGNKWIEQAKTRPIPKMLFSEFWHENELCILFADTNLGKSILAVQIADSISKGLAIEGFKLETEAKKVLYCDFELSDKQFENRYSDNFQNHYSWDSNFLRLEIDPNEEPREDQTFEDYLNESLERTIIQTEAKIIIIDNITYLNSETEKAKNALPLMKHLKALKSKHGLSILVLAHTPKRDLTKPITRNDLQGSKMLMNFIDSSFTIGESYKDKNLRYIKQIKERHTEKIYDSENVIVCQVHKPTNFLQFEFLDFGSEREHLKEKSEKDRNELIQRAKELSQKGNSQREIASSLGISVGAVNKYLKQ